jgi:hypothetical protein
MTSLMYSPAIGTTGIEQFHVLHGRTLDCKQVCEKQLREIGDSDINDTIERCRRNPYQWVAISTAPPRIRRNYGHIRL